MSEFGLTKQERLHGKKAIAELMEQGTKGFTYPFRYIWLAGGEQSEVLFAVSKRQHKRAVRRNLLRRRTREAYRLNKSVLGSRTARIALIYSSSQLHDFKTVQNAVCKILSTIGESV